MSKRKGQTNGSATRNKTSPATSGNAPEIDAAGAPPSADGAAANAAPIVAGADGVNGNPESEGMSDAQATGATATETVQQPESVGLGDAPALSGGGEGSAQPSSLESGGGGGAGATETDDDHSLGADGPTAADDAGHGAQSGGDSDGDGAGGLHDDAGSGGGLSDGGIDTGGPSGSIVGDEKGQSGSVGGGNPSAADGGGSNEIGDGNPVAGRSDGDGVHAAGHDISPDLKAAIELAGCESVEDLIDMARIGSNLFGAIDDIRRCEGPFKNWAPADDPVEIVHDLYAALEHAWEKAAVLEKTQPDEGKPWWLNMPNFAEDAAPLEISRFIARDVFVGVHGSVEVLGALIHQAQPQETPAVPFEAVSELVDLVRRIGTRATPDVLAQHLVITKHRQSADLTKAEELGLKAFASILIDLDDFAAAEKQRLEELAAEKPEPKPLPIEDTTMDTVNDTMETW